MDVEGEEIIAVGAAACDPVTSQAQVFALKVAV
jgi:hypothetical protein